MCIPDLVIIKYFGNNATEIKRKRKSSDKLCFVDHTRENINDGADFSTGTKQRFRS